VILESRFPFGFRAVYRGRRYTVSYYQSDEITLRDEETNAEVARVPVAELDEYYEVLTWGTYVGEPFLMDWELDNDQYAISFHGVYGGNGIKIAAEWRARQATDSAMGTSHYQEDQFTFRARVPRAEVHDIHEERRDLLGGLT
jgi:hypothetical protein